MDTPDFAASWRNVSGIVLLRCLITLPRFSLVLDMECSSIIPHLAKVKGCGTKALIFLHIYDEGVDNRRTLCYTGDKGQH